MARPVRVSTEQIVEAAREVFLERGYADATTLAIAQRARVSEGSLFKRFAGKAQLFCAAMNLPALDFLDDLQSRVGEGDVRAQLEQLAAELLGFIEQALPTVMMLWSHRNLMPMPPPPDSPPRQILRKLTAYLGAEMKQGRLQPGDAEAAARLLMGACWNYCLLRVISDENRPLQKPACARAVVHQLWIGLAPRAPATRARRAPSPKPKRTARR